MLKQDQQLLVFPLISALAALVVVVSFALPLLGLGAIDGLLGRGGSAVSMVTYVVGFLFYVSLYFVIFFNAALVGAAMIRFDGGVPTVRDGLRVANSKFVSILGYGLSTAATVGMVLRAIQERVGFIGRMVVGLLGVGWTVAT